MITPTADEKKAGFVALVLFANKVLKSKTYRTLIKLLKKQLKKL